jgi:hypothetical protein
MGVGLGIFVIGSLGFYYAGFVYDCPMPIDVDEGKEIVKGLLGLGIGALVGVGGFALTCYGIGKACNAT